MKTFGFVLALLCPTVFADTVQVAGSNGIPLPINATVSANGLPVYSANLISGEDATNGVMKTESQFSYCLDDADLVCKASAGFLHTVSCWGEDAAATAGRVQIRDSSTATGGTVVWQQEFAAAIATPVTWVADIIMTAGIAIDWDTTADVFCTVSYR